MPCITLTTAAAVLTAAVIPATASVLASAVIPAAAAPVLTAAAIISPSVRIALTAAAIIFTDVLTAAGRVRKPCFHSFFILADVAGKTARITAPAADVAADPAFC